MTSLAFASQRDCEANPSETIQLKRKNASLSMQNDLLNRIITFHETNLEGIQQFITQHFTNLQNFSIDSLLSQFNSQLKPVQTDDHPQICLDSSTSKRIDQLVQYHSCQTSSTFKNMLIDHQDELNRLKKALRLSHDQKAREMQCTDCDTSIEEYSSGKMIFEIPTEMQLLKEVADTYVQVDLQDCKRFIYQIPIEMHQIFEIPVQLKSIYEIPVEMNIEAQNRIYEVPIEMECIWEVDANQQQKEKIIFQVPMMTQRNKEVLDYQEQIKILREQIERLTSQTRKFREYTSKKHIYEIPIEMQIIKSEQAVASNYQFQNPPEIGVESRRNIENPVDNSSHYNSMKHVESKISTQICTRHDLDLMPSPHKTQGERLSIMMSAPNPIIQSEDIPSSKLTRKAFPEEGIELKELDLLDCQVVSSTYQIVAINHSESTPLKQKQSQEIIDLDVIEEVEVSEQATQTDFSVEKQVRSRVAKIPFLNVVHVPYEVERVVERIVKIPVLQVVEVPYEVQKIVEKIVKIPILKIVEVPTIVQIPVQIDFSQNEFVYQPVGSLKNSNTATDALQQVSGGRVSLSSKNRMAGRQVMIKEVPCQMILQSQPQVLVKQVPIEVILEKIVELPPRVIVKQIPYEVVVEKEVEVERVVIHEVPVEVIVEKETIIQRFIELPQKTIIKQIPYEVVIEKEVEVVRREVRVIVKQIPYEVVVQREVEKIVHIVHEVPVEVRTIEIREVPVEVVVEIIRTQFVDRVVQVPVFIQVPVQVIIQREKKVVVVKEVPMQVMMVEQVVKVMEIPMELQLQKIVNRVVQVPVIVYLQTKNESQHNIAIFDLGEQSHQKVRLNAELPHTEDIFQTSNLKLQSNNLLSSDSQFSIKQPLAEVTKKPQIYRIVQIPVEVVSRVEVEVIKEIPKIYEIPTELILVEEKEKIVYVVQERVVEVPVEVFIQKQVYIPTVVEVPVELVIYRDRVFQVPVEVIVYRDRLVEVPVEVFIEVPVEVIVQKSILSIREVPVEVEVEKIRLIEVPTEVEIVVEKIIEVEKVVYVDRQANQADKVIKLNEVQKDIVPQETNKVSLANRNNHNHFEQIYEVPISVDKESGQITYEFNSHLMHPSHNYQQIIIELPFDQKPQISNNQSQTQIFVQPIEKIQIGIQTFQQLQKIQIIQIPIELENIDLQQIQKDIELRYRDYLHELKQKYEGEIMELHNDTINLQAIASQTNSERDLLKQKIQLAALNQQSLLRDVQLMRKEVEEAQHFRQQAASLREKISTLEGVQNHIRKENEGRVAKRANLIEIPIEMLMEGEVEDKLIQTDDIYLGPFQIMQIPVHLSVQEVIDEEELASLEKEMQQKHLRLAHSPENIDDILKESQAKQMSLREVKIYELPIELIPQKDVSSIEMQTDLTVEQGFDLVVQQAKDKEANIKLYEIPVEIIQPIIYQIATELIIHKESSQISVQTEPYHIRKSIYELPIEVNLFSQTQEVQVQTVQEITSQSRLSQKSNSSQKAKSQEQIQQQEQKRLSRLSGGEPTANYLASKQKPHSEYFPSRIFEIPIELNLHKEKVLNSIEVQTEASQEVDEVRWSNIFLSRQREIIVSHLKIVPAFEPFNIASLEPLTTQLQMTPKKSQEQIMQLGSLVGSSDTDPLNAYQISFNAQSMTPNQFESSSYYGFPVPTININNISLIKKESLNTQNNPFLGSLDIRDNDMLHESAIASTRLATRDLLRRYEQESSSEQEGEGAKEMVIQNEMIIQQNQTFNSRDINRIQTPNLEPHDLNFSEYAKKEFYRDEDLNYQELYDHALTQLDALKLQLNAKNEEIANFRIEIDAETTTYEEGLRKYGEQLTELAKANHWLQEQLERTKGREAELEEGREQLERRVEGLVERCERLREEGEKGEVASGAEVERLLGLVSERAGEVREMRREEHHQRAAFEGQLGELRELVALKAVAVEQLEEELQQRSDRVDQLTAALEQMRRNLSSTNEADTAAIYEQEFERVKEGFEEEKQALNYQVYELREECGQLRERLTAEEERSAELGRELGEARGQVEERRHDYSSLHHLKSELENNYLQGVKGLQQELEEARQLLREKDEILERFQLSRAPLLEGGEQASPGLASNIRIEYLSKQSSHLQHDPLRSTEQYAAKLQSLLRKYQRIIVESEGTIQQLQEKVYEYLRDALEKEQEAEGLYIRLVDYENTLNSILVEKVSLEMDNKRLGKQIEASQKKLGVLGNRLIEIARNRAEYESDDDYYE